ncbi:MAG: hypothetical protein V3U79_00140 [Dehalococcoidia bacterium]
MTSDQHLRQLPNGKWMDTRYKFRRGTRVQLIDGPNRGRQATVSSSVFLQGKEDVPGYHLELAEEEWVTVRWDWVERHSA